MLDRNPTLKSSAGIPSPAQGRLCRLSRGRLALGGAGGTPPRQPPGRRRYPGLQAWEDSCQHGRNELV